MQRTELRISEANSRATLELLANDLYPAFDVDKLRHRHNYLKSAQGLLKRCQAQELHKT